LVTSLLAGLVEAYSLVTLGNVYVEKINGVMKSGSATSNGYVKRRGKPGGSIWYSQLSVALAGCPSTYMLRDSSIPQMHSFDLLSRRTDMSEFEVGLGTDPHKVPAAQMLT
jgi:hypothetical protein